MTPKNNTSVQTTKKKKLDKDKKEFIPTVKYDSV